MNTMKLIDVKTSSLVSASYNPLIRTEKKILKGLLESIQTNGILYPIMVDSKMNIIDGHRRVACAKL